MSYKIGFATNEMEHEKVSQTENNTTVRCDCPRKSVVEIEFPMVAKHYSYYNDRFDLKKGDIVFVDGALEGVRGVVVNVNYNFRIKLSDYKRVLSVADTNIEGRLYMTDSHFVAFDRGVIPFEKVSGWFKASEEAADEDIVYGSDGTEYELGDLVAMDFDGTTISRGHEYYMNDKVVCFELDGERGRAIVLGKKAYELSFIYRNGLISGLTCECYCAYPCKHKVALQFQLRDTLETIFEKYSEEYNQNGYFSAVAKTELLKASVSTKKSGVVYFSQE